MGQKWPFRVILSHFGGKRLEKLRIRQNWPFSHYKPLWQGKIGKIATQTKSNLSGGGGVHQPEPQCHVDPKFQLNLKNRGFLFSVFHKLDMYVCNERGVHQKFTLTCFNFSNPGGVHLQVDPKSVRFTDSGWLSTTVLMRGQLC